MRQHRHQVGPVRGWLVDDVVVLAVDAAVDGVDQAVALAAGGVLEEGARKNPLAAGRERHVDGLSMPPVITGSMPVPSGRARKMCEARVVNALPFGRS